MDNELNEPLRPKVWIIDTEHEGLESARTVLADWAEPVYYPYPTRPENDVPLPDAILFSAEIKGGTEGEQFAELAALADNVPLIAVSRLRSLAQAVAYFRAGAADYLSFPLDEAELRERIGAAVERAANAHMHGVMVELEAVDPDPGVIQLRLSPSAHGEQIAGTTTPDAAEPSNGAEPYPTDIADPTVTREAARLDDEDILAHISTTDHTGESSPKNDRVEGVTDQPYQDTISAERPQNPQTPDVSSEQPINPCETGATDAPRDPFGPEGRKDPDIPNEQGDPESPKDQDESHDREISENLDVPEDQEEPEIVDGLPIPTLWEELPCGLLVYDSSANLVFSNQLGLELFGSSSLADLQDALENRRADFRAHGANHKPVAENHWPQDMAWKTGTPRSAVLSVELPNRRRSWLRIDCLPHLNDGAITRLSMTVVNLTGELPPLAATAPETGAAVGQGTAPVKKPRGKRRGRKHRK
ncbi:MAG: hypothetical protein LUG50_10590 [Planctomycetaceae bacterium]|nr:hypothetical protein [Planctomycetaceae bacterium]